MDNMNKTYLFTPERSWVYYGLCVPQMTAKDFVYNPEW